MWSGVELVDSDYDGTYLVMAKESFFKETLAIKDTEKYEYVLINDDNVDFYTLIEKNGLGTAAFSAIKVGLGTLAGTMARHYAGGVSKEKLLFIKLKNGKRIIVIVKEGYTHLIRCNNKRPKEEMSQEDIQWVRQALDKNNIELLTISGKQKSL